MMRSRCLGLRVIRYTEPHPLELHSVLLLHADVLGRRRHLCTTKDGLGASREGEHSLSLLGVDYPLIFPISPGNLQKRLMCSDFASSLTSGTLLQPI